jgi:CHAT domain-containing protein
LRRQVEALVAEDEEIGASVRQGMADNRLSQPLTSVAELQNGLPPDGALLDYYLGEKESYFWLVQAGSVKFFRLPPRAQIEALSAPVLQLFPDVLGRKRSPEKQRQFEQALRRLSATLTEPLRNLLLPARLIVVPDGVLTRIPFAALELSANQRMGLAHDLLEIPSVAYLAAGPKPRKAGDFPKAILAIGDPVFSPDDPRVAVKPESRAGTATPNTSTLARLPFNGDLDAVSSLVPPSRRRFLLGFDANPDTVQKQPMQDYALLHFSTHALIDDRIPELSRVALSMVARNGRPVDGFLRPYQLAQLRLNGSTVVLSACDTALGKQVLGEGLVGFTASLFSAGAAQLVLTLSKVDAEGSSEFMSETYRNRFAARPASMEHAMTLARRSLARSSRWSDPFYWASFVIYGRPSVE